MTGADWQQIAEERLLAAQALLASGNWPSAYYLAGYAVEGGLKSCIVKYVGSQPEVIFQDKQFSVRCWSHGIEDLVRLARLEADRDAATTVDANLRSNWIVVANWDEKSRYQMKGRAEAEALYNAVDGPDGVMKWIRMRW